LGLYHHERLKARTRAKANAQAAIDAVDAALAAGAITEREWQHRVTDALAGAYLREADPWWQAGLHGDAALRREARELVLDAVPRDGTPLDVGCPTGHLMECLVTWGAERGLALSVAGLELHPALAMRPGGACLSGRSDLHSERVRSESNQRRGWGVGHPCFFATADSMTRA
jgi:hypothetical protein